MKRLFLSDAGEDSAHFWGIAETELQAVLTGDKALSWYDSFSSKMVLKRPFFSDTGDDSAHLFKYCRDRADVVDMIDLQDGLLKGVKGNLCTFIQVS